MPPQSLPDAPPLPAAAPAAALLLCVLALCALSTWLALRTLRDEAGTGPGPVERACLSAGIPLLVLAAGYDFAQREHLMAVAALPYLLGAARRIEGDAPPRRLATGTALLAAAGFALKPHFLLIPALVEGLVLVRRRRCPGVALADPVPWAMAAAWLAYLVAIPLLFPDYLARVLPLV